MFDRISNLPFVLNLQKQYEVLPHRDRLALKILGACLAALFVYFACWKPASDFMLEKQAELEQSKGLLELVMHNKAALKQSASSASTGNNSQLNSQQLVTSVTNLAKRGAVKLKRFEPSGENKIKVWVESVPFDKVIAWLSSLEKSLGVRVEQISIEKEEAPGLISARLTLAS